jgi:hypothetical protein
MASLAAPLRCALAAASAHSLSASRGAHAPLFLARIGKTYEGRNINETAAWYGIGIGSAAWRVMAAI